MAFGNPDWMSTYGQLGVHYGVPYISDHAPMHMKLSMCTPNGKLQFKFFNIWVDHEEFLSLVKEY